MYTVLYKKKYMYFKHNKYNILLNCKYENVILNLFYTLNCNFKLYYLKHNFKTE